MAKKQLTFEDLEPQYAAFCENVKSVKQNTYWKSAFNKIVKDNNGQETKETL
jgi:hypothetical protein